jgi:hypothetical protein
MESAQSDKVYLACVTWCPQNPKLTRIVELSDIQNFFISYFLNIYGRRIRKPMNKKSLASHFHKKLTNRFTCLVYKCKITLQVLHKEAPFRANLSMHICPTNINPPLFTSARTETRSVEVNILALFTDTEVNNCFSIYHNKTKMTKKQRKYF